MNANRVGIRCQGFEELLEEPFVHNPALFDTPKEMNYHKNP